MTSPLTDTTKTNGNDTALPDGGAVRRSGLPRLGSSQDSKKARKQVDVELPERGASVLLQSPTIGTVVDFQDRIDDKGEATNKKGFEQIVAMGALMLVEPEWDEEQLKAEASEWSPADFEVFSEAVLGLAGGSEGVQAAARADFLDATD